MSELRLTWRSLIRMPGAAAAAVLTVALGIGVNLALLGYSTGSGATAPFRRGSSPTCSHPIRPAALPRGAVRRGRRDRAGLAALGAFALAAFDVARRRYEMAVRIRLGATHRDLRRLIQRGVLRPVVIGSAAGLLAAWWAAQFAQSLVTGMNVRSPARFLLVALLFALVASLAVRLPLRRIRRTSPGDILRST